MCICVCMKEGNEKRQSKRFRSKKGGCVYVYVCVSHVYLEKNNQERGSNNRLYACMYIF